MRLRPSRFTHPYWRANDHVAALLERTPRGPLQPDAPADLLDYVADTALNLFGAHVFTLFQALRAIQHPRFAWFFLRERRTLPPGHPMRELAEKLLAEYGEPVAQDEYHQARIVTDGLLLAGYTPEVKNGVVRFLPPADAPEVPPLVVAALVDPEGVLPGSPGVQQAVRWVAARVRRKHARRG